MSREVIYLLSSLTLEELQAQGMLSLKLKPAVKFDRSTRRARRGKHLGLRCDAQALTHSVRLLDRWITGLLDYWIVGLLDYWITGLLDYWFTDSLVHWFTGSLVHWIGGG